MPMRVLRIDVADTSYELLVIFAQILGSTLSVEKGIGNMLFYRREENSESPLSAKDKLPHLGVNEGHDSPVITDAMEYGTSTTKIKDPKCSQVQNYGQSLKKSKRSCPIQASYQKNRLGHETGPKEDVSLPKQFETVSLKNG